MKALDSLTPFLKKFLKHPDITEELGDVLGKIPGSLLQAKPPTKLIATIPGEEAALRWSEPSLPDNEEGLQSEETTLFKKRGKTRNL